MGFLLLEPGVPDIAPAASQFYASQSQTVWGSFCALLKMQKNVRSQSIQQKLATQN